MRKLVSAADDYSVANTNNYWASTDQDLVINHTETAIYSQGEKVFGDSGLPDCNMQKA